MENVIIHDGLKLPTCSLAALVTYCTTSENYYWHVPIKASHVRWTWERGSSGNVVAYRVISDPVIEVLNK